MTASAVSAQAKNKSDQTITFPTIRNMVYGAADFAPGATASSGLVVTYSTTTPSVCTVVSGSVHVAAAGKCKVAADQSGNDDFKKADTQSQTFQVTPAPLTVTADNQSKVYGAAVPTLTASYAGFVNGDTAASLDTPPTLSTSATAASSVAGSPYAITASGASDPNYTISYVSGALTVASAPLTVTADNQSKVYGAAVPTLTASYTGFVNGDTAASLDTPPTLSTSATAASSVAGSPYAITASGAVDPNYTISYVAGALTVTPAPLTVTASDATAVYGDANPPTVTAKYSGFVNGDKKKDLTTAATCVSNTTSMTPVGSYASTCSGVVDSNYTISYVNGTVTVTPAPLIVTASDATTPYGAANPPTVTPSYSGFVNDDSAADLTTEPTCMSNTTSTTPVGTYASTCSGAVDPNYAISYVNGTVTVTKAALDVTAKRVSIMSAYQAGAVSLVAKVTSEVTGGPVAGVSAFFVVTNPRGMTVDTCTAVTNARGVATCTISPVLRFAIQAPNSYSATVSGHNYKSASATAKIGS